MPRPDSVFIGIGLPVASLQNTSQNRLIGGLISVIRDSSANEAKSDIEPMTQLRHMCDQKVFELVTTRDSALLLRLITMRQEIIQCASHPLLQHYLLR